MGQGKALYPSDVATMLKQGLDGLLTERNMTHALKPMSSCKCFTLREYIVQRSDDDQPVVIFNQNLAFESMVNNAKIDRRTVSVYDTPFVMLHIFTWITITLQKHPITKPLLIHHLLKTYIEQNGNYASEKGLKEYLQLVKFDHQVAFPIVFDAFNGVKVGGLSEVMLPIESIPKLVKEEEMMLDCLETNQQDICDKSDNLLNNWIQKHKTLIKTLSNTISTSQQAHNVSTVSK